MTSMDSILVGLQGSASVSTNFAIELARALEQRTITSGLLGSDGDTDMAKRLAFLFFSRIKK